MSKKPEKIVATVDNLETEISYLSPKAGGARSEGTYGGIYSFTDEEGVARRMLVKSDKPEMDIAEFLSGKIFEETAPDNSARVKIVKLKEPSGEEQVYIGSVFLDRYRDLSTEVNLDFALKKNGRVFAAGTTNFFTGFLRAKMLDSSGKPKFSGFPEVMATSLLVGDFDVHTGNVGLCMTGTSDDKVEEKLVRIDYAASFDNLDSDIHPHSRSRHPFALGPTNHFREYPRSMRVTDDFAKHAFEVASKDLDGAISRACDLIISNYPIDDVKKFALRAGIADPALQESVDVDFVNTELKRNLQIKISERQESLRDFATEIGLSLCLDVSGNFRPVESNGKTITGERYFEYLQKENPKYFDKLSKGEIDLHLRGKEHASSPLSIMYDKDAVKAKIISSRFGASETDKSISRRDRVELIKKAADRVSFSDRDDDFDPARARGGGARPSSSEISDMSVSPEPSSPIAGMRPSSPTSSVEMGGSLDRSSSASSPGIAERIKKGFSSLWKTKSSSRSPSPERGEEVVNPLLMAEESDVIKAPSTPPVLSGAKKSTSRNP